MCFAKSQLTTPIPHTFVTLLTTFLSTLILTLTSGMSSASLTRKRKQHNPNKGETTLSRIREGGDTVGLCLCLRLVNNMTDLITLGHRLRKATRKKDESTVFAGTTACVCEFQIRTIQPHRPNLNHIS